MLCREPITSAVKFNLKTDSKRQEGLVSAADGRNAANRLQGARRPEGRGRSPPGRTSDSVARDRRAVGGNGASPGKTGRDSGGGGRRGRPSGHTWKSSSRPRPTADRQVGRRVARRAYGRASVRPYANPRVRPPISEPPTRAPRTTRVFWLPPSVLQRARTPRPRKHV